jgi:hypothetical protein
MRKRPTRADVSHPARLYAPHTLFMAVLTIPGVTRVHARSLATQFLLQIRLLQAVEMRRETSRVSFLMCPLLLCQAASGTSIAASALSAR